MALRFLDKGEHFDLLLKIGDIELCFAEHFDSFVESIDGESIMLNKIIRNFRKNPVFKRGEDSQYINVTKYLNDENSVFSIDNRYSSGYSIMVGRKFSNNCSTLGSVTVDENDISEFNMIYSTRTRNSIIMTLYHVVVGEEFTCEKLEEKTIELSKTEGFVLPCSEDEMKDFLAKDEGVIVAQNEFFRKAVLDCYSYYPNYVQKYSIFNGIFYIGRYNGVINPIESFFLFYWFSKPEYYSFTESCIQRDEKDEIIKKNPYYTGVMPLPSSLPHLNTKAENYVKELGLSKDTIRDLSDLEDNPKVGPDGLNIILEFCVKSKKANENRDYEKNMLVCDNNMYWRVPGMLMHIFNTFDITPKQFIDRTIRELIYNHMNADTYWGRICDYVNMCEQLGIEVEKKIPKDVLRRHDVLSTKIKELKDEKIKQEFVIRVAENKKLLETIPDGIYTIISPENSNDLVKEGFFMNHCVGSYAYSYAEGSSKIFFVRRKDNVETSFVTLELDHLNRLVQISAFANKRPDKSVIDFVNEWLKLIRKEGN